jgi:hypothetical protein
MHCGPSVVRSNGRGSIPSHPAVQSLSLCNIQCRYQPSIGLVLLPTTLVLGWYCCSCMNESITWSMVNYWCK